MAKKTKEENELDAAMEAALKASAELGNVLRKHGVNRAQRRQFADIVRKAAF